jgi:glucose-1-phosphate thymidylyltransferase
MDRRGIILAGGTGSRLHPSTISVSKQLMPVFDKPMIYYPLCTLMSAGMRNILVITTPRDQDAFRHLLGDGSLLGINIHYAVQSEPKGIAEALVIGENSGFLHGHASALVLGDNLFFGDDFDEQLVRTNTQTDGATVFGYHVKNPSNYGVLGFDDGGVVTSIEEKPVEPKSNFAVTGLYFYDEHAPAYAREVKPSGRQELEITALNETYLKRGELRVETLGSGTTWLDTGTHRSLLQASNFVGIIEERQGRRICCPEELAWRKGWIDDAGLERAAASVAKSNYGKYLLGLLA